MAVAVDRPITARPKTRRRARRFNAETRAAILFLLPALGSALAGAEESKEQSKKPEIQDRISRTQHVLTIGGQRIAYTASAGTLL